MPTCAFISFRLGLDDGVSVATGAWIDAFRSLGFETFTVAGEGPVDHLIPGLAIDAHEAPPADLLNRVLSTADIVVVENLATIPMNLAASRTVARTLAGRRAVLHHHDPPWQRERYRHITELPPDDPSWLHVTVNELTRAQFAERSLEATTIYNGFDIPQAHPATTQEMRHIVRGSLDVGDDELLVVHPVRAIARKGIDAAIAFSESIGATYWLTGPAEEGFDGELDRLIAAARCRVIHRPHPERAEIYAACDAVVFPSRWEGFGNPPVEAALHRRPAVVGDYPVARELRALGFDWFDPGEPDLFTSWLEHRDYDLIEANFEVAATHLSKATMTRKIRKLLDEAGWLA